MMILEEPRSSAYERMFISFRVRSLRVEAYSQKEAEAAVGLRTDNGDRTGRVSDDAARAQEAMEVELMET